jgi:putative two-component system response regulator
MTISKTQAAHSVLVVDDDDQVAALLRFLLERAGLTVDRASDGAQAIRMIDAKAPDLVMLDLDMPLVGGSEVCQKIKNDPRTRLIPVIIITGQNSSDARLDAWRRHADEFLTKPFNNAEVITRCRSLLRQKDLVEELESAQSVVFALARAVEAKSSYTKGHSDRVRGYALKLADRLQLSAEDRETLELGAVLHDIGKLAIPDAILDKPGRLTEEEMDIVKTHPTEGVKIVGPLRSLRRVVPLIQMHHERMDGKGYPEGHFAGSLPLVVRILSVADVFDALSSKRPYRGALSQEACLEIMEKDAAAGGLDPELVRVFCEIQRAPKSLSHPAHGGALSVAL